MEVTNTEKLRSCWEDYKPNEALTICLEGTTNSIGNGSHGAMHKRTADALDDQRNSFDMPYSIARDRVANLLKIAFGCDTNCIKAQLDDSLKAKHKKKCKGLDSAQVTPHSGLGSGGPIAPPVIDDTVQE